MGELTKLKQNSTVKAYQEKFEALANQTQNLPESFFVSCFISGLKEKIRSGALMFKPNSITNAIGLAKLQESSIKAILKERMGAKPAAILGDKQSMGIGGQNRKEISKEWEEKEAKGLCLSAMKRILRDVCSKNKLYAMKGEGEGQDQAVEEEGGKKEELKVVSSRKMMKYLQKQPHGVIAQINSLQVADSRGAADEEKGIQPPDLKTLLSEFTQVFQEPKDLPPTKSHDHCIPLKPTAEPANQRPYDYPHFQIDDIEDTKHWSNG